MADRRAKAKHGAPRGEEPRGEELAGENDRDVVIQETLIEARIETEIVVEQLPEHYIEAQTSLADRGLRILKDGDAFAVLDSFGDLGLVPNSAEGLFFRDTRHLSRLQLTIEGKRPLLLGSIVQDDNTVFSIDLTNPDIRIEEQERLPRDIISIERSKFVWQAVCYERIALRNFDGRRRQFSLDLAFDADFRDLFEVRGATRERRGRCTTDTPSGDRAAFRYVGLDGIERRTWLRFHPRPRTLDAYHASFDVVLEAGARTSILVTIGFLDEEKGGPVDFLSAYRAARRSQRADTAAIATVDSSNDLFNEVARRSTADLYMLVTDTATGPYPYAGVPWYSTVFGRDGIITAMLLLWVDPAIARGVLRYLAATQAKAADPATDAQPGKILHERRQGEMAILGEVPFRQYYGTVDATPLFVMLAGMYFERTGDTGTLAAIWPNIEAALAWCDTSGDPDGDGFVEYWRETEKGLANQGWKDSHDSIFHADGALAKGPIALCEVQGYVHAAKRSAATIARALAKPDLASRLEGEADALKQRFEAAFWCEDIGTYALALDGAKQACRVRSSNAGHALFTGIADPAHARIAARTLMAKESFSGWGIRTIAMGEARYNPMSYHNGSVWPHDNALIALGFARYGMREEAARVFEAIFDASTYQDMRRLPELFCGFLRRRHRGPTAYPVACSPQAWAAAAPFGLLAACLGLELSFRDNEIRFTEPVMPGFLDGMVLRGLRLGDSQVDLRLSQHARDVTVNVLSRRGDVRVLLSK